MRRAKILATLGPSSNTQEKIEQIIHAGVNAVRINMSHGTRDEHTATIKAARAAAEKLNTPLAILVDLAGPKIRTRSLADQKPVQLETDALFTLTTRELSAMTKKFRRHLRNCPKSCKSVRRSCSMTARWN